MFNSPEIASPYPPIGACRPAGDLVDGNRWRAQQLFSSQLHRGLMRRAWSVLTRRVSRLDSLAAMAGARAIRQRHTIGLQTIPLAAICGSENRCRDFDRRFAPLTTLTRERWQNIAAARLNGQTLPAIDVVQIGECYFVRDGHHRVSVARALGEEYIEAEVTVWEACDRDRERSTLLAVACC